MEQISNNPIKIKFKSPLHEALIKLDLGEYFDVDTDGQSRSIGNLISAKISIWSKKGKLDGVFSRRILKDGNIRVYRIQ